LDNWQYSVTPFLEKKSDKSKWTCTTVYGPVDPSLKDAFWLELTNIGLNWNGAWIVGETNAIRNRREKNGISFDNNNTQHFNSWIDAYDTKIFTLWHDRLGHSGNIMMMRIIESVNEHP
jgi:hypothetical protein